MNTIDRQQQSVARYVWRQIVLWGRVDQLAAGRLPAKAVKTIASVGKTQSRPACLSRLVLDKGEGRLRRTEEPSL